MPKNCLKFGQQTPISFNSRKYFLLTKYFYIFLNIKFINIFSGNMNGKTEQISNLGLNQLQQQTNQKKTFVQDIFNINYVNTSKIYYQPSSQSSDVKVNNYLCYQQGQNLYKVTEIIYQDKIIRIQDKFQVNIDPQKLKCSSTTYSVKKERQCPKNIEKVRIFSKDARKNGKIQRKDKKNIVKNMVKIFIAWLEKRQSQRQNNNWEFALSQLKQMLQVQNFNNRLIKNIVNSKYTNKAFLAFLTDDAQDQIKYSRIQDKQSHYEAIQLYISLLTQNKNGVKLNSEQYLRSEMEESDSDDQEDRNQQYSSSKNRQNRSQNMKSNINSKTNETKNSSNSTSVLNEPAMVIQTRGKRVHQRNNEVKQEPLDNAKSKSSTTGNSV